MKHVVIPFTVKTESLETVITIIREFISAIEEKEPGTLMYKSLQKSDEPEKFLHVMIFEDEQAQRFHRQTEHCKHFVDNLYPLCTEMPKASEYNEIR
jgi:quinol monooxygenase YgiN